jgi:hypothetical protein
MRERQTGSQEQEQEPKDQKGGAAVLIVAKEKERGKFRIGGGRSQDAAEKPQGYADSALRYRRLRPQRLSGGNYV